MPDRFKARRATIVTDRLQPDLAQGGSLPTTAELKADIDSGRTGDKVPLLDPGLSPLGTDDEAAGRPPSGLRVALARFHETQQRWSRGSRAGAAHGREEWVMPVFIGFIAVAAVVFAAGIWRFA